MNTLNKMLLLAATVVGLNTESAMAADEELNVQPGVLNILSGGMGGKKIETKAKQGSGRVVAVKRGNRVVKTFAAAAPEQKAEPAPPVVAAPAAAPADEPAVTAEPVAEEQGNYVLWCIIAAVVLLSGVFLLKRKK